MAEKRQITKSEELARVSLQNEIQALIDNGCDARVWNGERPIVNPSTGEEVGIRTTFNVNLIVELPLYERVEKAMSILKNTGSYIQGKFDDIDMIAIDTYTQERNDKVNHIIQFALPNTGSTVSTKSDDFKAQLREKFAMVTKPSVKKDEVTTLANGEKVKLPF